MLFSIFLYGSLAERCLREVQCMKQLNYVNGRF